MSTRAQFPIAERFRPFGTTIFAEMTALAQRHRAVNLSQGFPDFDGPDLGKQAAIEAVRSGQNQYAPLPGTPVLREAIAGWASRVSGINCEPDREVTVTSGCTEAIAATMLGLLNAGDEVVVFEPYYDSYRACLAMADAKPRFVTMRRTAGGFGYDSEELREAFNERTRAVLINTPHNPTGAVFSESQLKEIAELCIAHDAIAISDEVYERLVYAGNEHRSIATLPGMHERSVVLSSSGKSFSLTGWKIGWAIAPPDLTAGIRSAHQFLTFAVATPLQHGVAALLRDGEQEIHSLVNHYAHTRSLLGEALLELGFDLTLPQGSYFILADHTRVTEKLGLSTDVDLCRWLPEHAGVAAIPPSAFYSSPEEGSRLVRFAYCKKTETIDEAINRLRAALGHA
ncbi:MAG: aminotransferase class I/II-fold pyridoxal phosphate-dependent enzyme [Phycisphaerales bacterium]|nr:aminotransferase class I/II-fold pyridoxal phosphate-dependent enzyme [Phycisphaerales bacterium]